MSREEWARVKAKEGSPSFPQWLMKSELCMFTALGIPNKNNDCSQSIVFMQSFSTYLSIWRWLHRWEILCTNNIINIYLGSIRNIRKCLLTVSGVIPIYIPVPAVVPGSLYEHASGTEGAECHHQMSEMKLSFKVQLLRKSGSYYMWCCTSLHCKTQKLIISQLLQCPFFSLLESQTYILRSTL